MPTGCWEIQWGPQPEQHPLLSLNKPLLPQEEAGLSCRWCEGQLLACDFWFVQVFPKRLQRGPGHGSPHYSNAKSRCGHLGLSPRLAKAAWLTVQKMGCRQVTGSTLSSTELAGCLLCGTPASATGMEGLIHRWHLYFLLNWGFNFQHTWFSISLTPMIQ